MSAPAGLSEQQALVVARALLTELARLHDAGGVSGVVGPATVLVDEAGGVRLVAGLVDHAYASPEVLSGQPPTPASDLYSAAALLAHLFRGTPTLPPSVDGLEAGAAWLLGPVLSADPNARPASAAAMIGAVDQLAEQRHGPEWRVGVGLLGAAGVAGGVPVLVLATSGSAAAGTAAAGSAGVAGAAGLAGGLGAAGAAGSAGGVAGAVGGAGAAGSGAAAAAGGVAGGVGGAAGAVGGGAAGATGAAGAGGASGLAGLAAPAGQVAAGGGLAAAPGGATAGGHAVVSAGGAQAGGQAAGQAAAHGSAHAAGHGGAHATAGGISKGVALKVGAAVAAGGVTVAGAAAAVVVLTGAETKEVDLPSTANIYLIGASDDDVALLSDPGTRPVSVDVDGAGTVTFPSVKGGLGACDGCELESPDGGQISFAATNVSGFNGIPGIVHVDRTLFVVGVFVGEDQPDFAADAVVDLSDADEDKKQKPDLGEPFFIGDGETSDGDLQEIVVPNDATTLYLGFADGFGFAGAPGAYGDNQGSVDIEVTID